MTVQHPLLALVLCLFASVSLVAAAGDKTFPGVEKLMTEQEYTAAGLDQLSPEQREALNRWLIRYTADEAEFIGSTDTEVKKARQDVSVSARLNESFKGWDGKTKFYLDNGQVWQQRLGGRYHYSGEPPEVLFKKNFLGFWTMTVVKSGMSVGVKRIQ